MVVCPVNTPNVTGRCRASTIKGPPGEAKSLKPLCCKGWWRRGDSNPRQRSWATRRNPRGTRIPVMMTRLFPPACTHSALVTSLGLVPTRTDRLNRPTLHFIIAWIGGSAMSTRFHACSPDHRLVSLGRGPAERWQSRRARALGRGYASPWPASPHRQAGEGLCPSTSACLRAITGPISWPPRVAQ